MNGKNEANPFASQVQAQDVANDDTGRRRQSWRLSGFDDGTFEYVLNHDISVALGSLTECFVESETQKLTSFLIFEVVSVRAQKSSSGRGTSHPVATRGGRSYPSASLAKLQL